jgi:acetyl esterase/lipase
MGWWARRRGRGQTDGRLRLPGLLLAAFLATGSGGALAACSGDGGTRDSGGTTSAPPLWSGAVSAEYLPGLSAHLYLPAGTDSAPLVVMVPGGSWQTADPTGLDGLARHLADAGLAAMPVEVRAVQDGAHYPTPVQDTLCAVAYGAATARSKGVEPGPLVVLGHSSGAHLAALAALTADTDSAACPYPRAAPGALVGLAGAYDVAALADIAEPLFGVSQEADPATWEAGNPLLQARLRPAVAALLIHGESDDLLPTSFTTDFAQALRDGGHPTTVQLLPGADHQSVYSAQESGDLVADWVKRLEQ